MENREEVAVLDSAKFDPRRYEGKPRNLPADERHLLRSLLNAMEERLGAMTDSDRARLLTACLNVSQINCAWDEYAMAEIVFHSVSHDVLGPAVLIPTKETPHGE